MPVPGCRRRVDAGEHVEDALGVARVDADAVVAHGEGPPVVVLVGGHLDARRRVARELQRVGDEVLQQLGELHAVALDLGQRPDLELGAPVAIAWARSRRTSSADGGEVDDSRVRPTPADPGVVEHPSSTATSPAAVADEVQRVAPWASRRSS
jgi:hypothetical protein